ncbi:MAG TPA: hypothetical protein VHZ07_16945 [Bryobacteraceae bacterium]|jgi:Tol biopolymer transport system component|nr:hypothetical protein [Bryobacteraceae bacterium]
MRSDLAQKRFGLSTIIGGPLRRAVYFDGSSRDIRMGCCNRWAGFEIKTDGSTIGINGKGTVVLTPDGRVRANFPEPANGAVIAWNHTSDRIARLADRDDREWLLQYWSMGSQKLTLITSIGHRPSPPSGLFPPTTISWFNNGAAITYAKRGKIFIYKLADRSDIAITNGMNPAWSPDGRWIAYRDDIGHTFVIDPGTRSWHALIPNIKILGGIRWSPDSQFVLVSVLRSARQLLKRPLIGFENEIEFVIYRLSDGAILKINPLVTGTTEDRVFWVVKPL